MAITYTNDIDPKMRARDEACMKRRGIDLKSAQWMCDSAPSFGFADYGNARHVYEKLADHSMPLDGAWPDDWLKTYNDWMNGGFQR